MGSLRDTVSAGRSGEGSLTRLADRFRPLLAVLGSSALLRTALLLVVALAGLTWYQAYPFGIEGEDFGMGVALGATAVSKLENNTRLAQHVTLRAHPNPNNYFFRSYSNDAKVHYLMTGAEVTMVQVGRIQPERTSVIDPVISTGKGLALGQSHWRMYLLYGLPQQTFSTGGGEWIAIYHYPGGQRLSFTINSEGDICEMQAAEIK